MSKSVTIYHNPRCSKSRKALELLEQRGIEPEIVDYLTAAPSIGSLESLLDNLGIEAHDMLRPKEAAYGEAQLSTGSSREDILRAIHAAPILLERPIVVAGSRAVIGRPPELILDLL